MKFSIVYQQSAFHHRIDKSFYQIIKVWFFFMRPFFIGPHPGFSLRKRQVTDCKQAVVVALFEIGS